MKKILITGIALLSAGLGALADNRVTVEFGYDFQFGQPDTGNVHIVNTGSTPWNGSFSLSGSPNNGDSFYNVNSSFTGILLPGEDKYLPAGPESSNARGYNGTLGILFSAHGTLGGIQLDYEVNDSNVHSGVPRQNPCGNTTDAYILQGGDVGCDTGDDFEVSQTHARFDLTTVDPVPEVNAPTALLAGGVGLALFAQSRRRKTA